jgi:hypothetical protein
MYLVGSGMAMSCGKLPFPIHTCAHCGEGIKVTRALKMMDASALLQTMKPCRNPKCQNCPLAGSYERASERLGKVGLIGVGEKYYTPHEFSMEATRMGISKRIPQIPKALKLGETWVFLAHKSACLNEDPDADTFFSEGPGVFYVFKPSGIEYLADGTDDPKKIERLVKKGIKIVKVPKDDPDHH